MTLLSLLIVYILGGLTFIPLLLISILAHAYYTFPVTSDSSSADDSDLIIQLGDDLDAIKNAQRNLGEKFQPGQTHDADVAAGYFAVCREYTPGGVGAKPPERNTPVGSTSVSAPSPSVYQTMYRSIFDRKPVNGPLEKGNGKPPKRGGNVFYVVLRYGSWFDVSLADGS